MADKKPSRWKRFWDNVRSFFTVKRRLLATNPDVATANKKQQKLDILKIILASSIGVLGLGAVVSSATVSALYAQKGSEFDILYDTRYQLNVGDFGGGTHAYAAYDVSPSLDSQHQLKTNVDDISKAVTNTTNTYAYYLNTMEKDMVDVYSQFDTKEPSDAFVNTQLPNIKYLPSSSSSTDKKKNKQDDLPKAGVYAQNAFGTDLTMVVDSRNGTGEISNITIIPLDKYINFNKAESLNGDRQKIVLPLNTSLANVVNEAVNDTDDNTKGKGDSISQISIIRDYNGLCNFINFFLQVHQRAQAGQEDATKLEDWLTTTDPSIKTFITNYNKIYEMTRYVNDKSKLWDVERLSSGSEVGLTMNFCDYDASNNNISLTNLPIANARADSINILPILFNSFNGDKDNHNNKDNDAGKNYLFFKNYVYGVGQLDKYTNASPGANSWLNLINPRDPNKKHEKNNPNPADASSSNYYKWITLSMPSLFAANQYLNLIKNNDITNVIPSRLIYNTPLQGDNSDTSNGSYNFANNVTFKIDRTNDNDFVNIHVFYGLIISIVCALLLIGLVVSLLYRIPGLLGFLACLGASGLAMMILLATGSTLSTNLVLGMVIAFAGLMLVVFNFGERVKGWTRYNEKYDLAIRKSFRSTIWQSILIVVVLITFGVAFTYFGLPQIVLLGNVLMLAGVLAIPFVVLLWPISCWLLLINRINKKSYNLFFSVKAMTPFANIAPNNYIPMYTNKLKFKKKDNLFAWWKWLIIGIIGALAIAGLVFLLKGSFSSSHIAQYRVIVSLTTWNTYAGKWGSYSSFTIVNTGEADKLVYVYYNSLPTLPTGVSSVSTLFGNMTSGAIITTVNNIELVKYAVHILLIVVCCTAIIAVLAFIHLKWFSIIPIFACSLITPLISICLAALFKININYDTMNAFGIVSVLTSIIIIHFATNLVNRSVVDNNFKADKIRSAFNDEIRGGLAFYLIVYAIFIGVIILFGITSTKQLLTTYYLYMIIQLLVSGVIVYICLPASIYPFIKSHKNYVSKLRLSELINAKNYDIIDEQLITTINSFERIENKIG